VLCKKENAHDENIWTCAWGRYTPEKKKKEEEPEGEGGDDEKSRYVLYHVLLILRIQHIGFCRDSIMSEDTPADYIITGALDDLVKVWELHEDKLELKHNLEGHSLGVVSVAISNSGKCKESVGCSNTFK